MVYLPLLPQVFCAELQREKDQLEAHMDELKSSVGHLTGEVQDLSHRERLLVAFPELSSVHQSQPQSRVLFNLCLFSISKVSPRLK